MVLIRIVDNDYRNRSRQYIAIVDRYLAYLDQVHERSDDVTRLFALALARGGETENGERDSTRDLKWRMA